MPTAGPGVITFPHPDEIFLKKRGSEYLSLLCNRKLFFDKCVIGLSARGTTQPRRIEYLWLWFSTKLRCWLGPDAGSHRHFINENERKSLQKVYTF
jgi:hypothetical protein